MANTWQGEFPIENLEQDGFERHGAGRARSRPTATACYDMIGNVWEWTTDWYERIRAAQRLLRSRNRRRRPGASYDPRSPTSASRAR